MGWEWDFLRYPCSRFVRVTIKAFPSVLDNLSHAIPASHLLSLSAHASSPRAAAPLPQPALRSAVVENVRARPRCLPIVCPSFLGRWRLKEGKERGRQCVFPRVCGVWLETVLLGVGAAGWRRGQLQACCQKWLCTRFCVLTNTWGRRQC